MNGRPLPLAAVLVAAVASSALWAHLRADETARRYGGQAQQRGANPALKSHESISVANIGLRCSRCFNEETAAMMGVEY